MKTHRTTNHLAKGAAALLALLMSLGSFAAAASALTPEPFEPPTAPGVDDIVGPDLCDLIDCEVFPGDDEDEDDPGDDGEGEDEPGDDGDDEGEGDPGDDDEDEEEDEDDGVEVEDETEENIDTPVEATPTFTG